MVNKHKYLEDINIKTEGTPWGWNEGDSRQEKWKKEREEYGFDERETWSLDYTFFCWLYERLMKYMEICNVDTEYHSFEVNGEELTQKECIDKMILGCKYYFKYSRNFKTEEASFLCAQEVIDIWKECIFSMWW